jgi:hypothetical protein
VTDSSLVEGIAFYDSRRFACLVLTNCRLVLFFITVYLYPVLGVQSTVRVPGRLGYVLYQLG